MLDLPGCSIGRAARWAAALSKYSERVLGMAKSTLAPSVGLKSMVTFASPVAAYTGMLTAPTDDVARAEDLAIQRLLRFPHTALPRRFAPHLAALGLPRVSPLMQSCRATLWRSALRHEAEVRRLHAALMAAREDSGSLRSLVDAEAHLDRVVWRAPALVDDMMAVLDEPPREGAAPRSRGSKAAAQCAEAVEMLLPRILRWLAVRHADDALRLAAEKALRSARQSSACYGVALLRTWCDGWNTDHRHGRGPTPCRFCGRRDADRVQHMIKCSVLMKHAAGACGSPLPVSVRDALCLTESPRASGQFRRPAHRPTEALLRIAVASEVYHKLRGRGMADANAPHRFRERQVTAAAKSAARKFRGV